MNEHIATDKTILKCIKFNDFAPKELMDMFQLRQDVFIIEQDCIYPDIDGFDEQSLHVLLQKEDKLIGYARILPAGVRYHLPSFGRFLIAKTERGHRYAHDMITYILNKMDYLYPDKDIKIQAQVYLKHFYSQYGFSPISKEYPEDDILHVDMIREAKANVLL